MQRIAAWPQRNSTPFARANLGSQGTGRVREQSQVAWVLASASRISVLDVGVEVEADRILVLLNLHAQEGCHNIITRDLDSTFVLSDEVLLEFLTGRCMYHVINEHTMQYPISVFMLHENGLLAVHCCVAMVLHPRGNPHMPLPSWRTPYILFISSRECPSGTRSGHRVSGCKSFHLRFPHSGRPVWYPI